MFSLSCPPTSLSHTHTHAYCVMSHTCTYRVIPTYTSTHPGTHMRARTHMHVHTHPHHSTHATSYLFIFL